MMKMMIMMMMMLLMMMMMIDDNDNVVTVVVAVDVKGELNLDNKWQSDYLFYIIMNEIHPRFNQFCVILKLS